jgi:pimeloyl-ACP methyl ester carboxylesterase
MGNGNSATGISIAEIGSFYVGGGLVALEGMPPRDRVSAPGGPVYHDDQNGSIVAGQMYVQFHKLASPRASAPMLMWHGGGMTGACWESTPDGRPGWQSFFLRAGFDTYVCDAVERGRASWAPYPQIYPEAPFFRTAKDAWEDTFRIGPSGSWHLDPALRRTYSGLLFPVDAFEAFLAQGVPRWGCNDGRTQAAYDALIKRLDPGVVVLAHSQGCNFALSAALAVPDRVRAVVVIEPSGAPDPAIADASALRHVPHLFVWGDNWQDNAFWRSSRPASDRWRDALAAAQCDVTLIDLPQRGIVGNSHALMADKNSDDVAGMVLDWLTSRGLAG